MADVLLFTLLSPHAPLSPSVSALDVLLVQCGVCLSTSCLRQVARQEEGVCRASEEDRGEVVEGEVGEVQCVRLYTCVHV